MGVDQVLIAGAGIGGLTAALAFAKRGVDVTVCERADRIDEVGAGLQMSPNAMKVLRLLGLEESLRPFAFVPQHAAIRDFKTGEYYLKSALGKEIEARHGAPYWHLHRADLQRVLLKGCEAAGVNIMLNAAVSHHSGILADNRVLVTLEDGRTLHTHLVVGADGIHSTVREQMLGPENPTFMKQVAWRGLIPVSELNIDIQPDACVWAGPNRHFVSYYVRGGEYVNFVAVEEREDWTSESWREEGDIKELQQAFAGWHPEVSELIQSAKSSFLWALNGREELPVWHKDGAVLLGDACHPMLPFMAQGAAMAIEDAYVLAEKLDQAAYLKEGLIDYEKARKPRTTKIQKMSQMNAGLYHMEGGVMLGKAKLKALQTAARFMPKIIQSKLDGVYGYDVTR